MTPTRADDPNGDLRVRVQQIIFEAETPAGKAFDLGLLVLIVLSVVAVMLESVASIQARVRSGSQGVRVAGDRSLHRRVRSASLLRRQPAGLRPQLLRHRRSAGDLAHLSQSLPPRRPVPAGDPRPAAAAGLPSAQAGPLRRRGADAARRDASQRPQDHRLSGLRADLGGDRRFGDVSDRGRGERLPQHPASRSTGASSP